MSRIALFPAKLGHDWRGQAWLRNLRILRTQKGFSQEELALHAGINRNCVGQNEREEKSPTTDMIEKLSKPLGVEPILLIMSKAK